MRSKQRQGTRQVAKARAKKPPAKAVARPGKPRSARAVRKSEVPAADKQSAPKGDAASSPESDSERRITRILGYLREHGPSPVTAVAFHFGVPEKAVRDVAGAYDVKGKRIFWHGKTVDGVWVIAAEPKPRQRQTQAKPDATAEATPDEGDGREAFHVHADRGHEATGHALALLGKFSDRYTIDNRLFRLETGGEYPRTIEVTPSLLTDMLTSVCKWMRYDARSSKDVAGPPPHNVVSAVLDHRHYDHAPELLGITSMPLVAYEASGVKIHAEPGFVMTEANAGYYVHGRWKPPARHRGKRQAAARMAAVAKARRKLEEPLQDFRFENPEVGKAGVIASLLTALLRPCIHGAVPALVLQAADGQAGKTLLANYIAIVATGREIIGETIPVERAWVGKDEGTAMRLDEEEFRKKLSADVLNRDLIINYDNCDTEIGGSTLEALITAPDRANVRLFKTLSKTAVRFRSLFVFNGNNPTLTGAMPRRVLRLQLLNHDKKEFAWGADAEFCKNVTERRDELIEALLVLVQGFFDAVEYVDGKEPVWPVAKGHWPTFSQWAGLVPAIIRYAGGADPLEARVSEKEALNSRKAELIPVLDLIELVLSEKRVKETKISGKEVRGVLVGDLLAHVCCWLGASRIEYEEAYRSLVAGVPAKERERVNRSYAAQVSQRFRTAYNNSSVDGRRFVVGADRNDGPVFAVVRE